MAAPIPPNVLQPDTDRTGYDCEFTKPPTDVFQTKCPVCLCILCDPHETNCCGTSFCYACLKRVQATGKPCPTCNHVGFSVHPNKGLKKSLIQLCVYCTHKKDGCEWSGELGQLDDHLNINPEPGKHHVGCGFVEIKCIHCNKSLQRRRIEHHPFDLCPKRLVPCTNEEKGCGWSGELGIRDQHLNMNQRYDGCGFVVFECMHGCGQSFERRELNAHESDCLERQYVCDYCREYESTFRDVTHNHFKECRKYPIPCPNECGHLYAFERQNLQDHLDRDCPLVVIECDFCFAGCKAKLQRKDMPAHLDENTNNHLSLLAVYSSDVSKQVEEDRKQITELEEKLSRTIQEKNDLETAKNNSDGEICQLRDEMAAKLDLPTIDGLVKNKTDKQKRQIDRLKHRSMWLTVALVVVIAALFALGASLQQDLHSKQEQTRVAMADLGASSSGNHSSLQQEVAGLHSKQEQTWNLLHTSAQYITTVIMTDFEKHKGNKDPWFSSSFYTNFHGYKMCLQVDASTNGGAHVSVYVHLMHGEFDNSLEWPFQGNITIQLLNQLEDKDHHSMTISFTDTTPDTSAGRVTTGEKSREWGYHKFISSEKLKYNHSNNCQYLKDDCLQFQVIKLSQYLYPQMSKIPVEQTSFNGHLQEITRKQEHIWKLVHTPILPVTFTMDSFSQHKRDDDNWFSEPFYTHPNGYTICLNVDANGYSHGEGTHISVFIHLMRGEFDDSLSWPFRGGITIELLNQLENQEHHSRSIFFDDSKGAGRVSTEERGLGWGFPTFISHNDLKDSKYLKNDRLQFRVTEQNPVLPCIITMDIFEHRKNEDKDWFSDPFYTHPHGYKMRLRVTANGSGDGKGTHVSVFVYLMRGEFDDHLEWPFRGEFAITLLNQLEDKQHHTEMISFNDERYDTAAGRVTTGDKSAIGWGIHTFISHNDLKDSKYLKNDRLQFRVALQNQFLLNQEVSKHSKLLHTSVIPFIITMDNFTHHKNEDKRWFSDPFYTHHLGYKMCLEVYANGTGVGKSTHISVFIHLMRGEFDDSLKWPFRGTFTIQLLNQLEDSDHRTETISYTDETDDTYAGRVTTGEGRVGLGIYFISHNELGYKKKWLSTVQYLRNDSLKFKITKVEL